MVVTKTWHGDSFIMAPIHVSYTSMISYIAAIVF